MINMSWKINFTKKAAKQIEQLSERAQSALRLLIKDLQTKGPMRRNGQITAS